MFCSELVIFSFRVIDSVCTWDSSLELAFRLDSREDTQFDGEEVMELRFRVSISRRHLPVEVILVGDLKIFQFENNRLDLSLLVPNFKTLCLYIMCES